VDQRTDLLTEETIHALLQEIAPGSTVLAIGALPGSYSNFTHRVDLRSPDGSDVRIVVRRYKVFGTYDRGEKARREFKTFELLQRNGIPSPQPLYLDEQGAVLGTPGIVTSYVPGKMITSPSEPIRWARTLATVLAKIHSVPGDTVGKKFLLDGNEEAAWFLHSDVVPAYMKAHPDGTAVWQMVYDLWPHLSQISPTLVHLDYWPGNILWNQGQITAVVDWEEAAFGDPGIDVAYCRMEMFLSGLGYVADEFLNTYEVETGQPVANLGFWELAAAARPMFSPVGRITESPARETFRQFIANARTRAGYG
jgi:aminoglycoside phosphotransferase (APT) family kinase protein